MAPSMAAVLRAPRKLCSFSYVLFVILLFYVLDVVSITVYDRHTLLNIGSFVAQCKPDFEFLNAGVLFTDTASEPFVWAAWSRPRKRRQKRGKRAGVLVRLRRHPLRPPLPTILLANVQSLDNKLCELRARISYQREIRDCCIICLTETWMSAVVPDSAIKLTGFSVHRSDRTKELTGKSRGGGVCFFINNSWCDERNLHSIKSFCSPDLEFHMREHLRVSSPLTRLRLQGIHILNYINDWLILAQWKQMAVRHRDVILAHMNELGLRLNGKKNVLSPLQRTTYLGVVWDSTTMLAHLSPARIESILTAMKRVREG